MLSQILDRTLKLQSLTALWTSSTLRHFNHLPNAKSISFWIQQFGNSSCIHLENYGFYYLDKITTILDLLNYKPYLVWKDCGYSSSSNTILDKVLSFNALVFTSDVQIGTFGLQANGSESSSCEPGHHHPQRQWKDWKWNADSIYQ